MAKALANANEIANAKTERGLHPAPFPELALARNGLRQLVFALLAAMAANGPSFWKLMVQRFTKEHMKLTSIDLFFFFRVFFVLF